MLPSGHPHTRPVDGVWLNERFYFDTGSRIAKTLMIHPEGTVHLESASEVVIVEGTAERVTDDPTTRPSPRSVQPQVPHVVRRTTRCIIRRSSSRGVRLDQ
jgi:hypothetical protein